MLGVVPPTLCDWERNRTSPGISHLPAVIRFLGYNLSAQPGALADRLRLTRRALGLSQAKLAEALGLEKSTILRAEQGRRSKKRVRTRLESFLDSAGE